MTGGFLKAPENKEKSAVTPEEVINEIEKEKAEFVCLSFCDIYGAEHSITVMPSELERAMKNGIPLDASLVAGFKLDAKIDLLAIPDPDTLSPLPQSLADEALGSAMRMCANIFLPDGTRFENDPRAILEKAVKEAESRGYRFNFGPAIEFYLFDQTGSDDSPHPYDTAGHMAAQPDDRCEKIRREICLDLRRMGIQPECSYHEAGPGQNKIKFRFNDPLRAADAAVAYRAVVSSVASRHGLTADFSPKPLDKYQGSSMHVNMSIESKDGRDRTPDIIAGILQKIPEITLFLNPSKKSYKRLGRDGAPKYISWSDANRSTLIRIPAYGGYTRFELRSPDNLANPYLAFALLIHASLFGISEKPTLQKASEQDLFDADPKSIGKLKVLPMSLSEAQQKARNSILVHKCLPETAITAYL